MSLSLSFYLSVCLSVSLSLSICLSFSLSLFLSICLSVFQSLSLFLSICLSVFQSLSLSFYLYVCLSPSLSQSMFISFRTKLSKNDKLVTQINTFISMAPLSQFFKSHFQCVPFIHNTCTVIESSNISEHWISMQVFGCVVRHVKTLKQVKEKILFLLWHWYVDLQETKRHVWCTECFSFLCFTMIQAP